MVQGRRRCSDKHRGSSGCIAPEKRDSAGATRNGRARVGPPMLSRNTTIYRRCGAGRGLFPPTSWLPLGAAVARCPEARTVCHRLWSLGRRGVCQGNGCAPTPSSPTVGRHHPRAIAAIGIRKSRWRGVSYDEARGAGCSRGRHTRRRRSVVGVGRSSIRVELVWTEARWSP